MKVDVYRTANPAAGFLFVPHGSEPPPSAKRPGGAALKPWKTTDLSQPGSRIGLTEDERVAVLDGIAKVGHATVVPKPK
jgi:hypothetical protein